MEPLYTREERTVMGRCRLCEIYIGPYFIEKELKRVKNRYVWILCNENGRLTRKRVNPNKESVIMCGSCFEGLEKRQKFIIKNFREHYKENLPLDKSGRL